MNSLRIKLIVTGDLERLALHESLRQLFPSKRGTAEVVWEQPRKLHCATSHQLSPGKAPSEPMLALAQAMLTEVGIGKNGEPADLVVVIDDVELGNRGQEATVVQHFRAAVNKKLNNHSGSAQARYRSLLREKCSFHLLCPMVESYLFGDEKALSAAGVPIGQSPQLVSSDVEQFQTDDPAWLPICHKENGNRKRAAPWWAHERHPKHYLEHLTERAGVFYEETDHGKRALTDLRWLQVPKASVDAPVIRSLLEDISDWFGDPNPLGNGALHPDLYPPKSVNRGNLLLRNL
ncbi:hypothetical protein FJV41_17355 [Myxococcus llanfairpwllgwyngyllgogerychwyrndrobwllllantysiliogogogochensis]|uniref:Uncharacterized protein n=1 Tax=Myxococcus llanfairpwllgwyngyllgogerychwyrndrobwllllantysiliogogogochensis TaxID=2590453 RepID=A0A540X1Z7_9BACT|nr:hypothetical protein [Myxococcus llanfairpwllgwyngyllgogerychwyrndrobwllllantysiliogogogochensis]TQF14694.1 hypothetical protein FJV41_17355 [Myxococcus llanfairpwllgwyngyllgogerychwyrndrobwllllantysiliogogogochensis]